YRIAVLEGVTTSRARNRVLQVRGHINFGDGRITRLLVFQRVLLDGAVDLAQVINASVLLRGRTSADEIRDGDRRQQTDDRNHDHNFNQREARLAGGSDFHFNYYLSVVAA